MKKLTILILAFTFVAAACNKTASVKDAPVPDGSVEGTSIQQSEPQIQQPPMAVETKPQAIPRSSNEPKNVPAPSAQIDQAAKDSEQDVKLENLDNRVSEVEKKVESPAPAPTPIPVVPLADTTPPIVSLQRFIDLLLSNDWIVVNHGGLYGNISLWTNIATDQSTGSGLEKLEYFLDGILIGSATNFDSSIAWNTTLVPNGTYELSVKVYDKAGNVGTDSTQVRVDNNALAGQQCLISRYGTLNVIVVGTFPDDSNYKIWLEGEGQIGTTSKENQTLSNTHRLGNYSVRVYSSVPYEITPPSGRLEACGTLTFTISIQP